MLRRFVLAGVAFVALIIPGTFGLALLAAPAAPTAVIEPPACEQSLRNAGDTLTALQAQLTALARADRAQQCSAAKLYFLAAVKTRALAALCRRGADRERELGRLDADVERINGSIAAQCTP